MITVGEACVLGVVQGLTEFLPVSSSGHLAVAHQLIAPMSGSQTAAVDVALHAGTLVATLAYFRHDLLEMLRALRRARTDEWHWRWIWLLALATLPAAFVGGLWKARIEEAFTSLTLVGASFLVTGLLLTVAGRARGAVRGEAGVRVRDALLVGISQSLALVPGISRSGSTITAGMLSGLRPDVAARFSFLMGIPAVIGAEMLEAPTVVALDPASLHAVLAGTIASAVSGWIAIWLLMRIVASRRIQYFAYYLWPLGALVLAVSWGKGG